MRIVIYMETTYTKDGAAYATTLHDLDAFTKLAQREARRQGMKNEDVLIDFGTAHIGAAFGRRRDK